MQRLSVDQNHVNQIIECALERYTSRDEVFDNLEDEFKNFSNDTAADFRNELHKKTIYFNGKNFSLEEKPGFAKLVNDDQYIHCFDENFSQTHGNRITENYVAMRGPQWKEALDELFLDTVFNKKQKIKHVIALGENLHSMTMLSLKPHMKDDFFDYCLQPREIETKKFKITIDAKRQEGSYTLNSEEKNNVSFFNAYRSIYPQKPVTYNKPTSIVTSKILVQTKKKNAKCRTLTVYLIPVKNGEAIDFSKDHDDAMKEFFWQQMKLSKVPYAVHCKAGQGRTGHFIFLIEVLKNYRAIFEESSVEIAANKCIEILEQIRKTRPCLVEFDNQFSEAIENAYLLYQYGLEKGYIVVQQQVNFFSSATSDSSKNNKESTTPNSPHVSAKNS